MGVRPKIDYREVVTLRDRGLTYEAIGAQLGCSKATVCKALKATGREITRAAVGAAQDHHRQKNTATEHLLFLLSKLREEYEWMERNISQGTDAEYRAWQDQKLKHTAEVRKIITAISDIGYKLYQAEEVAEILSVMDEEIGRESTDCQKRIRDRIERRRSIRFPCIPA